MRRYTFALAAIAFGCAGAAHAGPNTTFYSDHATFAALGTISQVTNFDSWNEDDFTVTGDPYVVGALKFESQLTGVFGKNPYSIVRNGIANDYIGPLTVSIEQPGFNLLSFAMGTLAGYAGASVGLYTNTGLQYGFGFTPYPAQEGYKFQGIQAPDGSYFTKITFTPNDDQTALIFSEFELGKTAYVCDSPTCPGGGAVPEPASWSLMILGFGAAGALLRNRRWFSPGAV